MTNNNNNHHHLLPNIERFGLLSDTHNNVTNLNKALAVFRQEGIRLLIHCGDMTDLSVVEALNDFQLIYVFGNVDGRPESIRRRLLAFNQDNFAGPAYMGSLGTARIAVTHGHWPGRVNELARSDQYDYIFHGHTHRRRDELIGQTRVINPGALGGKHYESRSVAILNILTGQLQFIDIADR